MNTDAIPQALTPLVGLPLRFMGRAADMLWLHFGEVREVDDIRGGTKTVGEWAIHVQCVWRLCREHQIEVISFDIYCDPSGDDLDDWDVFGSSRFDQRVAELESEFSKTPPQVLSLATDGVGGFTLHMSRGFRLDVFPCIRPDEEYVEYWRIFTPGVDADHFVVP